jgi:hypothetical protein
LRKLEYGDEDQNEDEAGDIKLSHLENADQHMRNRHRNLPVKQNCSSAKTVYWKHAQYSK